MPTRCNGGFYCRSYCLLNMFRAPLCPSSGAQEYYTGKLIPEQCPNDPNPLFQLAFSHPRHTCHKTEPVKQHRANWPHNPPLHTRPTTWKPQVCTSLLQMHAPVHFRIHTITRYKRDTWPTDRNHQALHCKKPTKNTHTRPPRHSTHLITNLDNNNIYSTAIGLEPGGRGL
jgi:hypothetical protein